ncbi:hypothetical protein [Moorena producens]
MGETTPVAHGGNPRMKALAPQDRAASLKYSRIASTITECAK